MEMAPPGTRRNSLLKMTSLERSGHQGALKDLQPLSLSLKLRDPKPVPQRALQEVSPEVLTQEGKAPGAFWKIFEESEGPHHF